MHGKQNESPFFKFVLTTHYHGFKYQSIYLYIGRDIDILSKTIR